MDFRAIFVKNSAAQAYFSLLLPNIQNSAPPFSNASYGPAKLEDNDLVLKGIRERLQCEIGEHIAVICQVFGLNLLRGGANHFLSRFKGGAKKFLT